MFFRMVYKSGQIFPPFCHNPRVWQTDRQTDGQTEFSSLDRVCIACSAVKTKHIISTKEMQIQIQNQTCSDNHEKSTNSSRSHGDHYFIY